MGDKVRLWPVLLQVVATGCVAALLAHTGPGQALENLALDWHFTARGVRPPTERVVIVSIDDKTLAHPTLGAPLIFWGRHYADAITALHRLGPRAIGLDAMQTISLAGYGGEGNNPDEVLARVLHNVPELALVYVLQQQRDGTVTRLLPTPQLQYALLTGGGSLGFSNLDADGDQVVRRQALASGLTDEPEPCLALALAATATGQQVRLRHAGGATGQEVFLGDRRLPTDRHGRMLINYRGPGGTFARIPFQDLLSPQTAARHEALVRGAIVLVGFTTPTTQDRYAVPFSRYGAAPNSHLMYGIEVHANTLHTLLAGDSVRAAGAGFEGVALLIALAISTVLFLVSPRRSWGWPWLSTLLIGALAAAWLMAGKLAFANANLVLPAVAPVAALLMNAGGLTTTRLRAERHRRREVEAIFGKYVSDAVLPVLLNNPQAVELGGRRCLVTVLFADIRGFTSLAETMPPEQVTKLLNMCLTVLADAVLEHGGIVDKYVGDALMALFNWPLGQPDHAARALRVALAMQADMADLERRYAAEGVRKLEVGIGIHTGPAVVGNIGSPRRMEITAIGDTINVGCRIEGLNREFGTNILVSEATREWVSDDFSFGPAREAVVRGRAGGIRVYPLLPSGASESGGV